MNKQGHWESIVLFNTERAISSFGEDEKGELYFALYADDTGIVYQINNVASDPCFPEN